MDTSKLDAAEVYVMTWPDRDLRPQQMAETQKLWAEKMPGTRLIIVGGGVKIEPLSHLDAAWTEAVAALPEGWSIRLGRDPKGWITVSAPYRGRGTRTLVDGPTPAAALRALAEKLRAHAAAS